VKGWNISAPELTPEEREEQHRKRAAGEIRDTSSYEFAILKGLQRLPHVFEGVAADNGSGSAGRRLTEAKIAKRRARGKVARRSRKGQARAAIRAARVLAGQNRKRQICDENCLLEPLPVLKYLEVGPRRVRFRPGKSREVELSVLDESLRAAVEVEQ